MAVLVVALSVVVLVHVCVLVMLVLVMLVRVLVVSEKVLELVDMLEDVEVVPVEVAVVLTLAYTRSTN